MNDVRQETFGETCLLGFFFTIYLTRKRSLESAWSATSDLMILIFLSMGNPSRFTMTRFLTFFTAASWTKFAIAFMISLTLCITKPVLPNKQKIFCRVVLKIAQASRWIFEAVQRQFTCTKYPCHSAWKLTFYRVHKVPK